MNGKHGFMRKLSYLGIVAVAILQILWLVNNYISTKKEINSTVNYILQESVIKELDMRCKFDMGMIPEGVPLAVISDSMGNVPDSEVQLQESLSNFGSSISLHDIDSIFSEISGKLSLAVNAEICLVDGKDSILKSSHEQDRVRKEFKSIKIPIRMDGSLSVQAFINNPYRLIFVTISDVLLATVVIMLFIGWCIIYQIKVIVNERRISQLKDTFSKAMIHDMKTPIAGIKLSTHLLRSIKPEEVKERDEMLGYIEKENEHLSALANKVLTIAKIEENKIVLNKKEFRLPSMIEDLVATYKQRNHKQVEFSLQLNVDTAFGEEEYIKEAISNLIDNAIKYSGDSVKITIGSAIEADMLCISVEDDGFGISREDRNRIFEKFQRGVGALKKGVSGFGLGLNYVKHVAEAHGGSADMMSRKGYGSVFMIMIPAKSDDKGRY